MVAGWVAQLGLTQPTSALLLELNVQGSVGCNAGNTMRLIKSLMYTLALAVSAAAVAPTLAQTATAPVGKPGNLVVLHVDQNDPAVMALTLNNAENVAAEFKSMGEPVTIEIVTYGPGLHMLRSDTSPVKARISALAMEQPQITFSACGNTQERMAQAEGKPVPLMTEAKVQRSGVVRLMQLQAKGYAYVKP